ncbi:MAG: hypothetical protein F4023_13815 [Acidobacteria bacterium]|nr:hypothetical protein [Acidobacteriota bacterium]
MSKTRQLSQGRIRFGKTAYLAGAPAEVVIEMIVEHRPLGAEALEEVHIGITPSELRELSAGIRRLLDRLEQSVDDQFGQKQDPW